MVYSLHMSTKAFFDSDSPVVVGVDFTWSHTGRNSFPGELIFAFFLCTFIALV